MPVARTGVVCLAFLICGSIVELGRQPAAPGTSYKRARADSHRSQQSWTIWGSVQDQGFDRERDHAHVHDLRNSLPQRWRIRRSAEPMGSRQARDFDNFLQDVFSYSGAAGVDLDAVVAPPGGSDLNKFAVFAEVINDSTNGVYKTVVNISDPSDGLSLTDPSITPGIFVDGSARTNVGCLNTATTQAIINVDVYSSTGGLLTTHFLTVPGSGWAQNGVLQDVSGGYLIWRLQSGVSPNCFAIVVDNQTNDGSFIPPSKSVN